MYRCPFPRYMVRVAQTWRIYQRYEESISKRFKKSSLGVFIKKYSGLLRNLVFVSLLFSKYQANQETESYRRANEILAMHTALQSAKYESNELTSWKKLMLGDIENPIFIMVEVSPSYEDKFLENYGISLSDYLGKTDFDVWSEVIANEFYLEDKNVARTGIPLYAVGTNPNGGKLLIIKERIEENNRVYIRGTAIDEENTKRWEKYYISKIKSKKSKNGK